MLPFPKLQTDEWEIFLLLITQRCKAEIQKFLQLQ